jgi:DNA-binding HxlR family transcriptional regulator
MTWQHQDGFRPDLQGASAVLGLVAGRWVLSVLTQVSSDALRHSELLGAISRISEKVLTDTLRRMERDGLIAREVGSGVPSHVVYRATPLGRTLDEPLQALFDWQESHWAEVEAARVHWDGE